MNTIYVLVIFFAVLTIPISLLFLNSEKNSRTRSKQKKAVKQTQILKQNIGSQQVFDDGQYCDSKKYGPDDHLKSSSPDLLCFCGTDNKVYCVANPKPCPPGLMC